MKMTAAEAIAHGPFAWPGGYALIGTMSDGEAICFKCIESERINIDESTGSDGWSLADVSPYWEGPDLLCCHCGEPIPSEYGDPDAEASA